jgi:hypothetical protein
LHGPLPPGQIPGLALVPTMHAPTGGRTHRTGHSRAHRFEMHHQTAPPSKAIRVMCHAAGAGQRDSTRIGILHHEHPIEDTSQGGRHASPLFIKSADKPPHCKTRCMKVGRQRLTGEPPDDEIT